MVTPEESALLAWGLRLPKHFGDIDVLAVDRAKRVVRVIECKDLALVRTPDELSNQLATFVPSHARDDAAATVKHRRRVDWVADNLDAILAALNLPIDGGWRVEGLFVVDEPLFVPHLRQIDMPVIALEELRRNQESE